MNFPIKPEHRRKALLIVSALVLLILGGFWVSSYRHSTAGKKQAADTAKAYAARADWRLIRREPPQGARTTYDVYIRTDSGEPLSWKYDPNDDSQEFAALKMLRPRAIIPLAQVPSGSDKVRDHIYPKWGEALKIQTANDQQPKI